MSDTVLGAWYELIIFNLQNSSGGYFHFTSLETEAQGSYVPYPEPHNKLWRQCSDCSLFDLEAPISIMPSPLPFIWAAIVMV